MRKMVTREWILSALSTVNITHLTEKLINNWLTVIGRQHLFTDPKNSQSNGLTENFFRSLMRAIRSLNPCYPEEPKKRIDFSLLQYCNGEHSRSHDSRSKLIKSLILRTHFAKKTSSEVQFYIGNDYQPSTGIIIYIMSSQMVISLDLYHHSVQHID